jgi:hypothetical protein
VCCVFCTLCRTTNHLYHQLSLSLSLFVFVFSTLGGGGGGGGGGRGLEKVIILDCPGIMISREKNCIFLFAYWKNQKKTHTQSSQCMAETIATHPPTHPPTNNSKP